jgi:hypothetical protein
MARLGKELHTRRTRNNGRISALRRGFAAASIASALVLGSVTPASAVTPLSVDGAWGSYGYSFSSGFLTTTGTVKMTIKDAKADGYCVHGSVTFNVSLAPDPTYDSPEVCGYGTVRAWTISLKKVQPYRVNGMLVKVCKTVASAPDPCDTEYHGR